MMFLFVKEKYFVCQVEYLILHREEKILLAC